MISQSSTPARVTGRAPVPSPLRSRGHLAWRARVAAGSLVRAFAPERTRAQDEAWLVRWRTAADPVPVAALRWLAGPGEVWTGDVVRIA